MSKEIPEEKVIVSRWVFENGKIHEDFNCERVKKLIASYLELIMVAPDVWTSLYRDPEDGRLWETVYFEPGAQAGGPKSLQRIESEGIRKKYGLNL